MFKTGCNSNYLSKYLLDWSKSFFFDIDSMYFPRRLSGLLNLLANFLHLHRNRERPRQHIKNKCTFYLLEVVRCAGAADPGRQGRHLPT